MAVAVVTSLCIGETSNGVDVVARSLRTDHIVSEWAEITSQTEVHE